MPSAVQGTRGDFHARIIKVEPGLYRAEYPGEMNPEPNGENPEERVIPDYHLADSVEAAKYFVESLAKGMNYARVVWDSLPQE
jgi:hypothetical protein